MRVLMPLPACDYDPTEAGVSHAILRAAGIEVVFATPDGRPARADPVMLSGVGLDPWGRWLPHERLVCLGLVLRADRRGRAAHAAMCADPAYARPLRWEALDPADYSGLLLPGGHAQGMREYLESSVLQALVARCFAEDKPVGAICHGVLLAARAQAGGRSVLHGRRTTALTWAFESAAWRATRWSRWWDPDYYRTYREAPGEPPGWMSVQAEVTRALAQPVDFLDVPAASPHRRRQTSGMHRDSPSDSRPAFVAVDGNYVSARWPGDAHSFAKAFATLL